MPHYHVTVRDECTRVYDIEADSPEQARQIVESAGLDEECDCERPLEDCCVRILRSEWGVDDVREVPDVPRERRPAR